MESPHTLRGSFAEAETKRQNVESCASTGSHLQELLLGAIAAYEECLKLVNRMSLFSPNETIEDIRSEDLQWVSQFATKIAAATDESGGERKVVLGASRREYEQYLKLLDSYDMLSRDDSKLYERYLENPDNFSTASLTDATARRNTKIARYKEEKELKRKLEFMRKSARTSQDDESTLRELQLTHVTLCILQTFQALESIAQELQILALAPPAPNLNDPPLDPRENNARDDMYSERLDAPLAYLTDKNGPILSKDGRPLRPFTLLDSRLRLQQGVFRPDHNLPTMSIDEYLAEERRRGGIIEGGGPQSMLQPEPDEDDVEKADEEIMKARAWDEFKEQNPKGAGNTMNMG